MLFFTINKREGRETAPPRSHSFLFFIFLRRKRILMANSGGQVPVVISTGLICLALGAGITVTAMFLLGFEQPRTEPTPEEIQAEAKAKMGSGADPMGVISGGKMQGKGMKGGPPPGAEGKGGLGAPGANTRAGAGKKGGFGLTPKAQLAMLVAKLDVLTARPLKVELSEDQRAKVRDQLKGLVGEDDLSEDDAKDRLDKLLEILQPQKATLEEAGFRWPGAGFPMQGNNADNPFKEGADADHLKNLEKRLEKSK
jgi:hypothetical protein